MASNKTAQRSGEMTGSVEQVSSHHEVMKYLPDGIWERLKPEYQAILKDLSGIPEQLRGVIPESAWSVLDTRHKLELLMNNHVIPKFEITSGVRADMEGFIADVEAKPEQKSPASVEAKELIVDSQEIADMKARISKTEELYSKEVAQLHSEEQQRVDSEKGVSFSQPKATKIVGHQPTQITTSNSDSYIHGEINSADTWIGILLQKLKLFATES